MVVYSNDRFRCRDSSHWQKDDSKSCCEDMYNLDHFSRLGGSTFGKIKIKRREANGCDAFSGCQTFFSFQANNSYWTRSWFFYIKQLTLCTSWPTCHRVIGVFMGLFTNDWPLFAGFHDSVWWFLWESRNRIVCWMQRYLSRSTICV